MSSLAEAAPADPPEPPAEKKPPSKWYERLSFRGYTQLRYNVLLQREGDVDWHVPNDRSVREGGGFFIRRARLILSGDVSDHLYLYLQPDFNALPADGDFSAQLRDAYADVSLDAKKEWRFRFGQSKVPFGFSNLQSSQNRLALERPDAINSAVEGERDLGVFFYFAPEKIRDRFRSLVRDGLKGSGDYGVIGLGVYNGQGLNRLDVNKDLHAVARISYPFELPNGWILEPGVGAYRGLFVSDVEPIDEATEPPALPEAGVEDRRVIFSLVGYPQPLGFETEWTIGEGPALTDDEGAIETQPLWGGYIQGCYRIAVQDVAILPFVRWQVFEGGRKFATNAPQERINELDFGVEWSFIPEVELTTVYTYTPYRTNTSKPPYAEFHSASRLGLQVQWNY